MDVEWTPTVIKGQRADVSLLQMATREHCLLLRVGEMRQSGVSLSPRLRADLEGQSPLKVGRIVRGQSRAGRTDKAFPVAGNCDRGRRGWHLRIHIRGGDGVERCIAQCLGWKLPCVPVGASAALLGVLGGYREGGPSLRQGLEAVSPWQLDQSVRASMHAEAQLRA